MTERIDRIAWAAAVAMVRAGRDVGAYTERCRIAEDAYDLAMAMERRREYLLRERDVMSRVSYSQADEAPGLAARVMQWVRAFAQ